jgi:hypothetical protein
MKRTAVILCGLVCLGALSGLAGGSEKVNPYSLILSKEAKTELAPKAAELVKKAKARDWSVTTINVVKAALEVSPADSLNVVNCISKAVPEMASIAAGTAAELQPKNAVAIAKVAADAAPSKAAKIVVAVARAVPRSCRAVAVAVCDAVPGSNRAILSALATAFPELAASIEKALADYTGENPSVGLILDQAATVALASSANGSAARGPALNPPYIPLTAPPPVVNGSGGVPVPQGGASYANP